jgi:hypothetical protein
VISVATNSVWRYFSRTISDDAPIVFTLREEIARPDLPANDRLGTDLQRPSPAACRHFLA